MLMPQPMKKTLTAETSAQKNFSCPRPNGCSRSGPALPRTSPTLSSTWLPTSASEWIVSANSVGDPVTDQPKPLDAAISELVTIDSVTDDDIGVPSRAGLLRRRRRSSGELRRCRQPVRRQAVRSGSARTRARPTCGW